MARVCLFDVNETLLDLGALDPHFEKAFGDAGVRRLWFSQVLQSALVATVTGVYSDFGSVGAAAGPPPHPEVRESLERLRDAGLRLATLTNNTRQVAEAQMESSGLRGYFEQILSADAVRRLKPAPEPYRMAAESLLVEGPDVVGADLRELAHRALHAEAGWQGRSLRGGAASTHHVLLRHAQAR